VRDTFTRSEFQDFLLYNLRAVYGKGETFTFNDLIMRFPSTGTEDLDRAIEMLSKEGRLYKPKPGVFALFS
jgi:hypothetical protein